MQIDFKVPSDIPADPVPDGDVVDSPIPNPDNGPDKDVGETNDPKNEDVPE